MAQEKIIRFTLIERLIHWGHALPFVGLLLTGIAMHWTSFAYMVFGSMEAAKIIHKIMALWWLLTPTLLVFTNDRNCLKVNIREIFQWHKRDFIWLGVAIKRVFKKGTDLPPQGRFNAGQKINSYLTLFFTLIFAITGLLIWVTQGKGWLLPAFIHNIFFILACPIFFGHLYLALVNRNTRESIKGIIWGKVDGQWAQEHHPLWYQDLIDETYPGLVFYGKEALGLDEMLRFVREEGLYPGNGKREIKRLFRESTFIISVYSNGTMIGLGRAVSDGISYGIITDTYIQPGFASPDLAEKIIGLLSVQLRALGVSAICASPHNNHQPIQQPQTSQNG